VVDGGHLLLPGLLACRLRARCVLALGSLAVALAAGASAHVNVNSTDARQGGFGKVTVRVPNESKTAGAVKVSVSMPAGIVMRSVKAKPHFGWTFDAPLVKLATPFKQGDKTVTEAVQVITWTADKAVSIKDGAFDEFEFTVGQLPTDRPGPTAQARTTK
jgi:periplasmic copper chaperone A